MNSDPETSRPSACTESGRLAQFVQGLLPESEAASLAAHADECPHCQKMLAEFDQEQSDLAGALRRGMNAPLLELPEVRHTLDDTQMLTALWSADQEATPQSGPRMSRLMRRLEQLPQDCPATGPDWIEWADTVLEFGPDGLPDYPQYRLQAALGAGGMGVVFEVFDRSLDRTVALKVLRPELAGDALVRDRFQTEAQAMAALQHDQIVRVFQFGTLSTGTLGPLPFLTMERFHGETLAQRLSRGPALTLAECLQISRDIARALAEAHRHGLVHRDVKPENVFLDGTVEEFQVKLLDFGLARDVSKSDLDDERGWVLGTPAWMAPEQARGEPATVQSDLFSLGCVMYRMLSGRLPFTGETPRAMLRARLEHSPVALQTLVPALPTELTGIVDELLSGDAARRPSSSADVARRLKRLADLHRRNVPVRSRVLVAMLAVLCVMAVVAVGSFTGLTSNEDDALVDTGSAALSTRRNSARSDLETVSGNQPVGPSEVSQTQAPPPFEPLDEVWLERVSRLDSQKQVTEVVAELKRRNPGWSERFEFELHGVFVNRFRMFPPGLRDVSPVRALPNLKHLQFPGGETGGEVTDLSPLEGLPLSILDCGNNPIADFSPLRGMPLNILRAKSTLVSDLSPLAESPIHVLQLAETPVKDLSPIKGCSLRLLSFWSTPVSDLSPLAGMTTLKRLECERTQVTDLSPLHGLKLEHLACQESPIEDYSILAEFPLKELHISYDRSAHRDLLLSIPTLEKINYRPAQQILQ